MNHSLEISDLKKYFPMLQDDVVKFQGYLPLSTFFPVSNKYIVLIYLS